MLRKIFKTGHSWAVSLSKSLLDKAGIKAGDSVEVEVWGDGILISKSKKGRQMDLGLKVRAKM